MSVALLKAEQAGGNQARVHASDDSNLLRGRKRQIPFVEALGVPLAVLYELVGRAHRGLRSEDRFSNMVEPILRRVNRLSAQATAATAAHRSSSPHRHTPAGNEMGRTLLLGPEFLALVGRT